MSQQIGRFGGWKGFYRQLEELKDHCDHMIDIPIAGQLKPGVYITEIVGIELAQTFFDMKIQSTILPGHHSERIYYTDKFSLSALAAITRIKVTSSDDAVRLRGSRIKVRIEYQPNRYRIRQDTLGYVMMVDGHPIGKPYVSLDELKTDAAKRGIRQSWLEIAEYDYVPT